VPKASQCACGTRGKKLYDALAEKTPRCACGPHDRLKAELQTPSTIIAVIDSGVDLRHRALKRHLWLNQSEQSGAGSYDDDSNGFVDDTRGWNFVADIAAPGENIRTAHLGNSYISLTGTSASAGFVAAAAGLLKSRRGWVSAQTIRQTIIESADESFDLKDKVAGKGALNSAAALSLFTRDHAMVNPPPGSAKHNSLLASAVAAQSAANLDTMRSSQPQAPNAYQQTGTLPPAGYDNPKPTIVANYDAYLTLLTLRGNATGVAGSLPMQLVDPTAGTAGVGGWSHNLGSGNYNFTAPVLSLPGRAGLDLSLALSYNSRVWTKYEPSTYYQDITAVFN
jgi:hypothetical protein